MAGVRERADRVQRTCSEALKGKRALQQEVEKQAKQIRDLQAQLNQGSAIAQGGSNNAQTTPAFANNVHKPKRAAFTVGQRWTPKPASHTNNNSHTTANTQQISTTSATADDQQMMQTKASKTDSTQQVPTTSAADGNQQTTQTAAPKTDSKHQEPTTSAADGDQQTTQTSVAKTDSKKQAKASKRDKKKQPQEDTRRATAADLIKAFKKLQKHDFLAFKKGDVKELSCFTNITTCTASQGESVSLEAAKRELKHMEWKDFIRCAEVGVLPLKIRMLSRQATS